MTDRYIATSASGEHVIRTANPSTAAGYARKLRGRVIDTFAAASKRLIDGIAQEIGEDHPNALSHLDILDGVGGQR
ncbi:MAG: hypothetical protein VYC96_03490 [Actinomycetota bacterium]|nr:hypothetical protein [Actinomycetota bacterium]